MQSRMILILISFLVFSACATSAQKKKLRTIGYNEGFKACDEECLDLQRKAKIYIDLLERELSECRQQRDESWQK